MTSVANIKNILKVRIGNEIYEVIEVPDVEKAAYEFRFPGAKLPKKARQVAGMVDITSKTILIDKYLSDDEKDSTLLHEVSHVILPKLPEKYILELENNLFPILNENGFRFIDRPRNRAKRRTPASSPKSKRGKKAKKAAHPPDQLSRCDVLPSEEKEETSES